MVEKLVPDNFDVPESFIQPEFIIRKLMFDDAKLDYKAVMSSVDIIKKTRGGDWPSKDLSFEDDQIDLGCHQREFEHRSSFAYTVMSPDENKCLGCLYLYPPGYRNEKSRTGDVDVSFWVTQEAYDEGLYLSLYNTLDNWLRTSWPFKKIVYTNKEIPEL